MNVLLYGKVIRDDDHDFIQDLVVSLDRHNIHSYTSQEYNDILISCGVNTDSITIIDIEKKSELSNLDMVLSIGGDGTMLASSLIIKDMAIPILGFNTGRLGFLANIDKENSPKAIEMIANNQYSVRKRSMLRLESENSLFGEEAYALNDFTIQKKTSSSMITIHCHIDGEYFNSYWCNGIILATPTGSTAFSMSCGGPIVMPNSHNIILTPIAPHHLNVRPVILPDNVSISFKIESRNDEIITTLDSRNEVISPSTKLTIRINDFKVHLVELDGYSYFTTLRNKLLWGKDVRNH